MRAIEDMLEPDGEITFAMVMSEIDTVSRAVEIEMVAAAAAAVIDDRRDASLAELAGFAEYGIVAGDFWIGFLDGIAEEPWRDALVGDVDSYQAGFLAGVMRWESTEIEVEPDREFPVGLIGAESWL